MGDGKTQILIKETHPSWLELDKKNSKTPNLRNTHLINKMKSDVS